MPTLLLGEPLTRYQVAGGVLVLLGVGLANRLGTPDQEVNAAFGQTAEAIAEAETDAKSAQHRA